MYFYQYDEFKDDINHFCAQLDGYQPDIILAIARGGVTFGHFLSEKLNVRSLYTLNSVHYEDTIKLDHIKIYNIPDIDADAHVLVVDDIVDSGDTMSEVMRTLREKFPSSRFKSGVLFYKQKATFQPDFKIREAHDWIHFFWNIN